MDSSEAQRLRSLERENIDLKKLLADAHLDLSEPKHSLYKLQDS